MGESTNTNIDMQMRMHVCQAQCCSAVRSTVSAALRAGHCGELYYVAETRSGVNRTLSLRAFQFIKTRFLAQQFIFALFQREILQTSNVC